MRQNSREGIRQERATHQGCVNKRSSSLIFQFARFLALLFYVCFLYDSFLTVKANNTSQVLQAVHIIFNLTSSTVDLPQLSTHLLHTIIIYLLCATHNDRVL
jgi:hypothetical protein